MQDTINTTAPAAGWRTLKALHERLNQGAAQETVTLHALRYQLRNAATNGLAQHIRRVGRKLLISEPGYLRWIDTQPREWRREA